MASFFGIGVGPGDSELLTVKAVETIKRLDVLYVPQAHKGGKSVAEKIAAPYLPADLVIKKRHFPMVNDWEAKMKSWRQIADEIKADVQASKNVGFLTLGDPSVYSTFSYLADLLTSDIDVQTIAGISAFSQIAASLVTPLMLDEESLAVIPATADEEKLEKTIALNDNVIIMKVATHFKAVYQILQARHLLQRTIIVVNASMADQQVKTMADYSVDDHLPYFTTAFLKKGLSSVNAQKV